MWEIEATNMEPESVKKALKIEESPTNVDLMLNGRPKRSRVTDQGGGRYGSAEETIFSTMLKTRNMNSEAFGALHTLGAKKVEVPVEVPVEAAMDIFKNVDGTLHSLGAKKVELPVEVPVEVAVEILKNVDVCQCGNNHDEHPVRGATKENAFEIDDDDDEDDLRVVAFRPRPLLSKNHPPMDEGGKFRDEGILTAEEISGHQKVIHDGMFMNTDDGDFLIRAVKSSGKEVKSALKSMKAMKVKPAGRKAKVVENPPKSEKVKEGKVVEDVDEVEERLFLSPRHKKTKGVIYAKEEEGDDYEVRFDSDSDREPEPEPEDPLDDIWKECAIMDRQSKRGDEDEELEGCEHDFEIKNDVGRACVLCGLIKEDIKDMSFVWRRPCTVRKAWVRGERIDTWDGEDDGVLEEEAKLVGMAALEAHPYLESRMHPHQSEGFKILSRNLVEEDSGGCMLAFAPGTGKSFLVICFIQSFMVQVPNARPMIVAPKSMLRPWMVEFKKWEVEEITLMNLYEAENQVEMLKLWQETRSVLLVGYSQFTNMSGEVGRYLTEGPGLMVLDEGHLARTESTKILKSLSRVHTKRRVLLSGTPFNNNFEEFYTTLELVRPNFMMRANPQMCPTLNTLITPEPKTSSPLPVLKKSSNAGRQAFKDVIGEKFESGQHDNIARALKQLRMLIEPFVAWHKGQVLETLPGITDLTIMLELSFQQRELLKNCGTEVRDNLQKRAVAIYLHPILEPVAEHGKRSQKDPRLKGNIDVKQGVKLRWVLDLVQFCNDAKEKVLIFSEYLYSLELIENQAEQRMKWSRDSQILRLDGKLPPQEREKVINKFNNDPEAKMLCASIKACGEGISLVGASRVVILEVVWNPAVMRQAISRAFRIGQQKKVVVYRLIAADTFEEQRMHMTATRKEWLSKLLFDPTISCEDPNSILWDVTDECSDNFLEKGPLRCGVKKIYEREF